MTRLKYLVHPITHTQNTYIHLTQMNSHTLICIQQIMWILSRSWVQVSWLSFLCVEYTTSIEVCVVYTPMNVPMAISKRQEIAHTLTQLHVSVDTKSFTPQLYHLHTKRHTRRKIHTHIKDTLVSQHTDNTQNQAARRKHITTDINIKWRR